MTDTSCPETRRRETAIATEIRQEYDHCQNLALGGGAIMAVVRMARRLASVLKTQNPRFDSERFYEACGCGRGRDGKGRK